HDELAEAGVEVTIRDLLDDGWRFDEFDESKIERDESGRFSSSGMTSTDDGHRVKLKIQHTKDFGPKVGVVPYGTSFAEAVVDKDKKELVVTKIHVDEYQRGTGKAKDLIMTLQEKARKKGLKLVTTGVYSEHGK